LRLSADCQKPHQRQSRQLARWPVLATPWLPAAWREAATLPALSPDCADDGRTAAMPLQIDGVADGIRLSAPPGRQQGVKLALRALGTTSSVQWLLDGRWIGETQGAAQWVFELKTPGKHTLTALADNGAWDSRVLTMLDMHANE
jgi:penicillin-binding protein 1C